ncbi:MAG: NUDIX hydrolase [bacterium]|nr:NUDIX hydrolase [bacterium]
MKKWEVLDSKLVFDTKWYKVRKDHVRTESGKVFDDYYLGAQPDYISLVALFDNGDALVDRQYRHGAGEVSLETIGGVIEPGEDPISCGKRELLEETGYACEDIELLSVINENPTKSISKTYILLATGLKKVGEPKTEYNESEMELLRMPLSEIISRIQSGEVFSEPAIASVFLVSLKLGLLNAPIQDLTVKKSRLARLPLLSRLFK